MSRDVERRLERAERLLKIGQIDGAIDALREVLTSNPDLADAHAQLALCLLHKRRLHAARIESGIALSLDPESLLAHWAAAEVALAKREFKTAEQHIALLREQMPEEPAGDLMLARCYSLTGRGKARLPLLEEALRKEPDDPTALASLADYFVEHGDAARAEHYAADALRRAPEHQAALVAMGSVLLLRGDVTGAREHAALALRDDPTDPGALRLLTSIKARSNPLLGLWWRYATWGERVGPARQIVVLLVAFVLYRVAVLAAAGSGETAIAGVVQIAWLAFVVYSFAGQALFRRALSKELANVTLRPF